MKAMVWQKSGVVFSTDGRFDWALSHASFPTAVLLDDRVRIYYSARGSDGRSVISFFDVAAEDPTRVIAIHPGPVLTPGRLGTFDDCGVQPNCALRTGDEIRLYYLGWNPAANGVIRNSTGLAVSRDGGVSFVRAAEGPVLDRHREEPYFAYTPWVMPLGDDWTCWYGCGTGWRTINGKPEGLFHIRQTRSGDGIDWERPGRPCIVPAHPDEVSCRPCVIHHGGRYRMWFSVRDIKDFRGGSGSYRLGYAESPDGRHWERRDGDGGIDVTADDPAAWDSQMICFASIVVIDGTPHLFYNGNGFGLTGIGHARLIEG